MARRRAIGEAIQRNSSRFADIILQQRLAEIQAARQAAIEKQRLETQAANQLQLMKTQEALRNPQIAQRLARGGEQIPSGWLPTQGEMAGPLYEGINSADSLTKMPSEGALLGQFEAAGGDTSVVPGMAFGRHPFTGRQPDTQHLLDARKERQDMLMKESSLATTPVDRVDPTTGNKMRAFVPTRGLSAIPEFATELGGAAAGKVERDKLLAGPLSPEVVSAETNRAGRIAGAQESATLAVRFDPQNIARQLSLVRQQEELKAQIAGDAEGLKLARQAELDSMSAIRAVQQLQGLYDKVKTSNALSNLGRNLGDRSGALPYVNPEAALLDRQRRGFAMVLAPVLGIKPPISDRDMESAVMLTAGSTTPPEVGDPLYADLQTMLMLGPVAARELRHLDFQGRIETVKRWIKLLKEAPADVDMVLDPETGIEFKNVRKQ